VATSDGSGIHRTAAVRLRACLEAKAGNERSERGDRPRRPEQGLQVAATNPGHARTCRNHREGERTVDAAPAPRVCSALLALTVGATGPVGWHVHQSDRNRMVRASLLSTVRRHQARPSEFFSVSVQLCSAGRGRPTPHLPGSFHFHREVAWRCHCHCPGLGLAWLGLAWLAPSVV
jgi:hypothetical protein